MDSTTPQKPTDTRPLTADRHFFWIESAFLAPVFKEVLSKTAWASFVLLCRRCSPQLLADGVKRYIAFSGIQDLIESLGIPRAAAEKAMAELRGKHFIRPRPDVVPSSGNRFLRGRGIEILHLPLVASGSKITVPINVPRAIETILTPYANRENRAIFLPSKLVETGKLQRLIRSWDMMRLAFRVYDLVDHSDFGAVPQSLIHADAALANVLPVVIEAHDVENAALVGKKVYWLVDFDLLDYKDTARYRLGTELFAPLGMSETETIKALIMLKDEGIIRWKNVIICPDPEDPDLDLGGYENTAGQYPGQYPWIEIHPGQLPYIMSYFGDSGSEHPVFVVQPFFQAQTSRVLAYKKGRRQSAKEFRDRINAPGDNDEDDA